MTDLERMLKIAKEVDQFPCDEKCLGIDSMGGVNKKRGETVYLRLKKLGDS